MNDGYRYVWSWTFQLSHGGIELMCYLFSKHWRNRILSFHRGKSQQQNHRCRPKDVDPYNDVIPPKRHIFTIFIFWASPIFKSKCAYNKKQPAKPPPYIYIYIYCKPNPSRQDLTKALVNLHLPSYSRGPKVVDRILGPCCKLLCIAFFAQETSGSHHVTMSKSS